jgi:hypothetical protein
MLPELRRKGEQMSGYGRFLLLLPVGASLASAASAQQPDRPVLLPQNDVAVIYRFDGSGASDYHKWQVTSADKGQRVRHDYFRWFEAKYPYVTTIYDGPANRFITIYPESKTYTERPIGKTDNPAALLKPDMNFTRVGTSVVAFATCTDWRVQFPDTDEQDTACVTDDGILLRIVPSKPNVSTMTATAIRYGAPPPGVFDPPPKFKQVPAR